MTHSSPHSASVTSRAAQFMESAFIYLEEPTFGITPFYCSCLRIPSIEESKLQWSRSHRF